MSDVHWHGESSRRSFLGRAALASSAAAVPATVLAGEAKARAKDGVGACAVNSRTIDLSAKNSGRTYRLKIAIPLAPPPPTGYPLLFVLDGDAYFGVMTDATRNLSVVGAEIAAPVVIGVGYPDEDPTAWYYRRVTDYTPRGPAEGDGPVQPSSDGFGGLAAFIEFLANDALAAAASIVPVDHDNIHIFGHSFGGLAALSAIFSKPELFHGAVAISPSIYWGDEAVMSLIPPFIDKVRGEALAPRVYMAVGELEEAFVPNAAMNAELQAMQRRAIDHARMIGRARDLSQSLHTELKGSGAEIRFAVVPGASHVSAPYAALPPALDLILPARGPR